ncbi:MAG: ABC transporter substrate-binding protein [Proteobacteria bacterium]|nr:ABC transporter substrate-binding protein [Pseudomonadota bacterium]
MLAFAAGTTLPLAVHAQAVVPIRIGAANATDHAAAFIGVEKGIFAKHGLDAKVVMYQSGPEMINGLLNGQQDVNIMGSVPFLAGVSRGQPLVLIGHLHGDATRQYYADNNSIVASAASGVKANDVKALAGKKIGLPRGTGAEGYLLGILGENGVKVADVTLVNLQPSNQVTALMQNQVDAIAAWEPWASAAVARVPRAVRVVSAGCKSCYDPGTILTTRDEVKTNAEALRRFAVAFAEAQQWLRQHYDEAAEINMRWVSGVDLDVMKQAIRRSNYDMRLSRNTQDGYTSKAVPLLVADKRMTPGVDLGAAIDPEFVLYAEKTAPQYFSDLPPIAADRRF